MDTISSATDTNASVLSAMSAARIRVDWPQSGVNPALVFARPVEKCVQLMSIGHDGAFLGHVAQGYVAADRGLAITTFPTRSGPPL